jgi:tRNA (adenine57-N1/adenine58-N1)-methyltransferase
MKILLSRQRKYLIKDLNKDMHIKEGNIKSKDLKKKRGKIITNKGEEFYLLEPTFLDRYEKIKRRAQIITKKDIGIILTETGINHKSRVLDAGTGTGTLAGYLGHIAKEVISYEIREDFTEFAKKNIMLMGLKNVKIRNKDITKGITEKNLDLIVLDIREPWEAIKNVEKAIKIGGYLVVYTPQITQALQTVNEIQEQKIRFIKIKTLEAGTREWELEGKISKPIKPMISHTAFITIYRRI